MENFSPWKSRKLWAAVVTTAIGTTVSLTAPAAATPTFLGFLVTMYALYVGGNLGEHKLLTTPFLKTKDPDDGER